MDLFNGRFSGKIEGDFVVFLIGARINKLSRAFRFVPVAQAMTRMQKELLADQSLGCLHIENWFGRNTLSLQYWRSFEHLEAYSCLLYTSPSPRDKRQSRMPSSA